MVETAFGALMSRVTSPFFILKALKLLLKDTCGQICFIVRNKFLYIKLTLYWGDAIKY